MLMHCKWLYGQANTAGEESVRRVSPPDNNQTEKAETEQPQRPHDQSDKIRHSTLRTNLSDTKATLRRRTMILRKRKRLAFNLEEDRPNNNNNHKNKPLKRARRGKDDDKDETPTARTFNGLNSVHSEEEAEKQTGVRDESGEHLLLAEGDEVASLARQQIPSGEIDGGPSGIEEEEGYEKLRVWREERSVVWEVGSDGTVSVTATTCKTELCLLLSAE